MSSKTGTVPGGDSGLPAIPAPVECIVNKEPCIRVSCCVAAVSKANAFQWLHSFISRVAWDDASSPKTTVSTLHGPMQIPIPLYQTRDPQVFQLRHCMNISSHQDKEFKPVLKCGCDSVSERGNIKMRIKRMANKEYKILNISRESILHAVGLDSTPEPGRKQTLYGSFAREYVSMDSANIAREKMDSCLSAFDLDPHVSAMCSVGKTALLPSLQVRPQIPEVQYLNEHTNTSLFHRCQNKRSRTISSPLKLGWSVSEAEFHEYDQWRRGGKPAFQFSEPYTGMLAGMSVSDLKQNPFASSSGGFGAYMRPRFPNGHNNKQRNNALVLHMTKTDDADPSLCEASQFPGMCMVFAAFPNKAEKLGLAALSPLKLPTAPIASVHDVNLFDDVNMEYLAIGSHQPLLSVERTLASKEIRYSTGSNVANSWQSSYSRSKPVIVSDFQQHDVSREGDTSNAPHNYPYTPESVHDEYKYEVHNLSDSPSDIEVNVLVLTWKRTFCIVRLQGHRAKVLLPHLKPGACLWIQSSCYVRPLLQPHSIPQLGTSQAVEKQCQGVFQASNQVVTHTQPPVAAHRSILAQIQVDLLEELCVPNDSLVDVVCYGGKQSSLFYQAVATDMVRVLYAGNAFMNKKHVYLGFRAGEVFLNGHACEVVECVGKWGYPGYMLENDEEKSRQDTEEEKQEARKRVANEDNKDAEPVSKKPRKLKVFDFVSTGLLDEDGSTLLFETDQEEEVQQQNRGIPEIAIETKKSASVTVLKKVGRPKIEVAAPAALSTEELERLERGREVKVQALSKEEAAMAEAPFVWLDDASPAEREEAQQWSRGKRLEQWTQRYVEGVKKPVERVFGQYHVDRETGVALYSSKPMDLTKQPVDAILPYSRPIRRKVTQTDTTASAEASKESVGWLYSQAVAATKAEIDAGLAYLCRLHTGIDGEEGTSDGYYHALHASLEAAERSSRGASDSEWAICEACGKWRVVAGALGARFFCGGPKRNSQSCLELDDWILRCQRGDTVLTRQLADMGCHTVEGLEAKASLLTKMRAIGVVFDAYKQTLKRLQ